MSARQTKLRPLIRSLAAVMVVVWVAARVLCVVHCNFGGGHGDAKRPSCHGASSLASQDAEHSPGPRHEKSSPGTICLTLKSALLSGSTPALVQPESAVLYILAPRPLDATTAESAGSISRVPRPGDWVFTPEVCLGPAFRSLAPPLRS